MYKCPKCKSFKIISEKRENGNSTCHRCGHIGNTDSFYVKKPSNKGEEYITKPIWHVYQK